MKNKYKIFIFCIFLLYIINILCIYSDLNFLLHSDYKLAKIEYNLNNGKLNLNRTEIDLNYKLKDKIIINFFILNSFNGLSVGKLGFENHYVITSMNNKEILIIQKGKYYEVIYNNYLYYPLFPFLGDMYFTETDKTETKK